METKVSFRETTLVVDPARLVEACTHLRDDEGFNFLSDVTPVDYLGWGEAGVSGYYGTPAGRNLNEPMTQGYGVSPEPRPKRFAVNYHLLALGREPRRVRVQVWLDDGESVDDASSESGPPPTGTSARPGT